MCGLNYDLLTHSADKHGVRTPCDRTVRAALAAARGATPGKSSFVSVAHSEAHDLRMISSRSAEHMTAVSNQAEVLAALARHPSSAKIVAEEAAKKVAHREALLARRRQIETTSESEWLKDVRAQESALAAVRAAEAALKEANRKLSAATAARENGAYMRRAAIERIDAELMAGADEASIGAFYDEPSRISRARCSGALVSVSDVRRSEVTGKLVGRTRSNAASVRSHILALVEALRGLDVLKLEPDQSRLADRFAQIRAAIPPIDADPQRDPAPPDDPAVPPFRLRCAHRRRREPRGPRWSMPGPPGAPVAPIEASNRTLRFVFSDGEPIATATGSIRPGGDLPTTRRTSSCGPTTPHNRRSGARARSASSRGRLMGSIEFMPEAISPPPIDLQNVQGRLHQRGFGRLFAD